MLVALLALSSLLFSLRHVRAQPASVPFTSCAADLSDPNDDPSSRINVTDVFAQLDSNSTDAGQNLKMTFFAQTGREVIGSVFSNATGDTILSTLFTTTSVLTFTIFENSSWFCSTLRPPSPLPALTTPNSTYCPLAAGPLAFSISIPLRHKYTVTSLITRIRIVDPSSPPRELACVDVDTTPVGSGTGFGYGLTLFWVSVGLTIGYWIIAALARLSAAWNRGRGVGLRWAGTVLASAVSGERLAASPALLRFVTPSFRDIIFHTQWCASLAMIAVEWPRFAYPILANTAWATLLYNVTLTQSSSAPHFSPLLSNYTPPSTFAPQLQDPRSPLFLSDSTPNSLYLLPGNATDGLSSFAYAVGIRPRDLFGVCLGIWACIAAGIIVLSLLVWMADWLLDLVTGEGGMKGAGWKNRPQRAPRYSGGGGSDAMSPATAKEAASPEAPALLDDLRQDAQTPTPRSRKWWQSLSVFHYGLPHRRRTQSSFHRSTLQGNLLRLLFLFHLPITIFSTHQFILGPSQTSLASFILAVFAFTFLSILIPAFLVYRLTTTPTSKLYDATRTLLVLGPLYSQYAQGSQMFAAVVFAGNLAAGLTIGAGQKSGTVQSIIILVLEVTTALATSIWLPWGEKANMGALSFLFCVARIVTAVLLVILSPIVAVGAAAAGWITYAIIVIQAFVYLTFGLMFLVKIIEGIVRLYGRAPFDKSKRAVDTGLFGALALAGCCGLAPRSRKKRSTSRNKHVRYQKSEGDGDGMSISTQGQSGSGTTGTGMIGEGVGQSSNSVQAPPSVGPPSFLRPEQALTPYREEADDDSGYIMRAWQPYSENEQSDGVYQTVAAVDNNPTQPSSSGFSRVGGGRARFDSPFAINNEREYSPQSMTARRNAGSGTVSYPPPPLNLQLPPGARAPISPSTRQNQVSSPIPAENPLTPPPHLPLMIDNDDVSTDSSAAMQKPKFWFTRARGGSVSTNEDIEEARNTKKAGWRPFGRKPPPPRRESSGDSEMIVPSEVPSPPPAPAEGASKSFIVVRKPQSRPNTGSTSGAAASASHERGGSGSGTGKSFEVVRTSRPGTAS